MSISRRTALATTAAAIATAATVAPLAIKAALAGQPDPLLAGVQALVNEIREYLGPNITMGSFWALQQAADRLEALPGIVAVPNEHWTARHPNRDLRYGLVQVLRPAGEVLS